jgi:GH35 family endo-1,4-beta-xylanase
MNKSLNLILILTFSLVLAGFGYSKKKTIRQIVEQNYPQKTLYVGATSSFSKIGSKESKILAKEFSYTTPANDFKQTKIHPKPGEWKWDHADAWVEFARKHNQIIRIHGPISPQCSKWAKDDTRTPEELEKNLSEFVSTLCKRYNDEPNVVWMDVINETVSRDGTWKKSETGDRGWEMPWEKIGYNYNIPEKYPHLDGKVPLYILRAFEIATTHAPDKKLIINQHGNMSPLIWNKIKDLVMYLRDVGYRVDGIGWQAHISYGRDIDWESKEVSEKDLKELIRWAHANNLEFHVTEFNLHVPVSNPGTAEQHEKTYITVLNALLETRGSGVIAYNLWNIKDVPHFQNKKKQVIAPWDSNLEPKNLYFELRNLLDNPPATDSQF